MPNALYQEMNPALQHMTPTMVMDFVGFKVWDSCRKIISVREPIERAISDFLWFKRAGKLIDFDDYLNWMERLDKTGAYWIENDACHFIPLSNYIGGIEWWEDSLEYIFFDNFEKDVTKTLPWVESVPKLNANKDTFVPNDVQMELLKKYLAQDIEEYNNLKELYGQDSDD